MPQELQEEVTLKLGLGPMLTFPERQKFLKGPNLFIQVNKNFSVYNPNQSWLMEDSL